MTENETSYQIRGAIFDAYNHYGPGLLEKVYQLYMIDDLKRRGCTVRSEVPIDMEINGVIVRDAFRLDLLVNECVIVELKSVAAMKEVFFKQLMSYLRVTNKKLGLLVNFKTDNIVKSIYRRVNGL